MPFLTWLGPPGSGSGASNPITKKGKAAGIPVFSCPECPPEAPSNPSWRLLLLLHGLKVRHPDLIGDARVQGGTAAAADAGGAAASSNTEQPCGTHHDPAGSCLECAVYPRCECEVAADSPQGGFKTNTPKPPCTRSNAHKHEQPAGAPAFFSESEWPLTASGCSLLFQ